MAVENPLHLPSAGDILRAKEAKEPLDPNFLQRARRWTFPLLVAGTALLAIACGSGARAVEPNLNDVVASTATPTLEPTATVVPIIATEIPMMPPTATLIPIEVPPTPTKAVPTPPTIEVKPNPTPEKVWTQEELSTEVDRIIELVQNPNPDMAKKYIEETDKRVYPPRPGAGKESLEADTYIIVYGPRDLKNPKPHQPISLLGIKDVIDVISEGNSEGYLLAQKRIKELILSNNMIAPRTALGSSDDIRWTKKEIDQHDPQRKIIDPQDNFFWYSKFREEPILALFKLYYALEPVTATK